MKIKEDIKRMKVQTSVIPTELTGLEMREKTRGIALYYKNDEFISQSFFTPPNVGEINWIDGLTVEADVHFREIELIGTDLLMLYVVGREEDILKMCRSAKLYNILRGLYPSLTEKIRARKYIDISAGKPRWHVIASIDKKTFYIANNVKWNNKKTTIDNVIILGDRLYGLTDKQEVVTAQLIPDIIEKRDTMLEVEAVDEMNKFGKIDKLEKMPNVENSFLATIKNTIYQFDLSGEMLRFKLLDENVKKINSVSFNNTKTIMATTDGLYEIEVIEGPNMIKAPSLPRMIVAPHLKDNFTVAMYVEDPDILGVSPATGIFAKTEDERVLFF